MKGPDAGRAGSGADQITSVNRAEVLQTSLAAGVEPFSAGDADTAATLLAELRRRRWQAASRERRAGPGAVCGSGADHAAHAAVVPVARCRARRCGGAGHLAGHDHSLVAGAALAFGEEHRPAIRGWLGHAPRWPGSRRHCGRAAASPPVPTTRTTLGDGASEPMADQNQERSEVRC